MTERTIPPELPDDPRSTENPGGEREGRPPIPLPPVPSPAADTAAASDSPSGPTGGGPSGTGPYGGRPGPSQPLLGRLAVGVGVILLGLISLFPEVLRTLVNGEIWRLWPLILIGFGAVQMFRAEDAKRRHGASWLIVSGLVLLVHFLPLGLTWSRGWPLWIVGAGVIDLTFPEKARDRGIGLFLLALGTFLLLWRVDTIPEGWERGWPLLVILFGVVLVWQALFTDPDGRARGGRRRHERRRHGDAPPTSGSQGPYTTGSSYQQEESRHG